MDNSIIIPDYKYYSSEFVLNNIKKASKIIRIVCVRNMRVTEVDILIELEKFILERNGEVEIFALSSKSDYSIIEGIRQALPNVAEDSADFIDQIRYHEKHINNFKKRLDSKKDKFNYYQYLTLPLIHLCQFDDDIYLGLQLFKNTALTGTLLDYCNFINSKSKIGTKILEQIEFLKDEYSNTNLEIEERITINNCQNRIFLSYSKKDLDRIKPVLDILQKIDFVNICDCNSTTTDSWGIDKIEEIDQLIKNGCRYFIPFTSVNYRDDIECKKHLNFANNAKKMNSEFILPIRLDDTSIPTLNDTTKSLFITDKPITILNHIISKLTIKNK